MTASVSSGAGFDPRKEPAVSTGPHPQPEPSPEGLNQRTDNPGPSETSIIERAADVIEAHWYCPPIDIPPNLAPQAAMALADAGLLVTDDELATRQWVASIDEAAIDERVARAIRIGDAQNAVVDAAVRVSVWAGPPNRVDLGCLVDLCAAVDAYLAARGEDQ